MTNAASFALSAILQDVSALGTKRRFTLIGTAGTTVAFEYGLALNSTSVGRIKNPLYPPLVAPTAKGQDLALSVLADGLPVSSPIFDEPSSFLRYTVLQGSVTSCYVDSGAQPSTGPAGPTGGGPASAGPAVAISLANVASLSGLAVTVDGVALSTVGMRVYLNAQTTAAQNGFWLSQTGAWTRPADWATGATIPLGTQIQVAPGGTANFQTYGSTWYVDSAGGVVDTGTIVAYPITVRGQTALASGTPSTVTVSNLWIKSATTSIVATDDITTAANGVKGVLTAGAGTGTLVLTGPNTVTDTVAWTVTQG